MNTSDNTNPFSQHQTATVESNSIGPGTRIWAYVHVLPGARIGAECNICDHVFIENDIEVGDNVTIKSGVQLWDGVKVGDNVFIGPNATFTNDLFPRSKQYPEHFVLTSVEEGASIGANATILAGVTIGTHAIVGAGSVVTQDVPPYAVVVGNPAQIVRYVNVSHVQAVLDHVQPENMQQPEKLSVAGCELWRVPSFMDMRGALAAAEFDDDLPFIPKRCFFVYSVPNQRVRGEHALRECAQFLVAVHGNLSVVVDDGNDRAEVLLNKPDRGLLIPAGIWGTQYKFSKDAVLCVFASHAYNGEDYIREYSTFIKYKNS